jgi:hypothetical protein
MIKRTFTIIVIISLIAIVETISASSHIFALTIPSPGPPGTTDIQSILSAIQDGQSGRSQIPSTNLPDIQSILSAIQDGQSGPQSSLSGTTDLKPKKSASVTDEQSQIPSGTTDLKPKKSASVTDEQSQIPSSIPPNIQSLLSLLKKSQLPSALN